MNNSHSKESAIQGSAPCVRTTSKHYYGDACPGHHLDFVELVPPKIVEDNDEKPSLADKLRRIEIYEPHYSRIGKVAREKAEAFEAYNSETFDPEEEGS